MVMFSSKSSKQTHEKMDFIHSIYLFLNWLFWNSFRYIQSNGSEWKSLVIKASRNIES